LLQLEDVLEFLAEGRDLGAAGEALAGALSPAVELGVDAPSRCSSRLRRSSAASVSGLLAKNRAFFACPARSDPEERCMKHLTVMVRGTSSDHEVVSAELPDEEIDQALDALDARVGTGEVIRLAWLVVQGSSVVYAHAWEVVPGADQI
jgi:hypothetical protein